MQTLLKDIPLRDSSRRNALIKYVLLYLVVMFSLYLCRTYNYLLFHTLCELICILIACSIFIIAWNTRNTIDNNFLLILGIAYLFVSIIDLVHTLAYSGMNIFKERNSDISSQLWICARFMETGSFLIAPFLLNRKIKASTIFCIYSVLCALVLVTIFYWEIFPACFIKGTGLTPFKIISEYIISLLLFISLVCLITKRDLFESNVLYWLCASIAATILSELSFTLYVDFYGNWNMTGHFLKFLSFAFIYNAIIYTSLQKPYDVLFRNIRRSEEQLRKAHTHLEAAVRERTYELMLINRELEREIASRKQLQKQITEIAKAEQRRIGHDLHDGLGQLLTGIAIKSELLSQILSEDANVHAKDAEEIEQLIRKAIIQTQQLAQGLSPVSLQADTLENALQQLATSTTEIFYTPCIFSCNAPIEIKDSNLATHLYRIAQEAVNNAVKHSRAKRITITLDSYDDKIVLSIEDNGIGVKLSDAVNRGMGIHTMNYRAEMIGGTLDIESATTGGTCITCVCNRYREVDKVDEQGKNRSDVL